MMRRAINEIRFDLMEIYDKLNDGQAWSVWFHSAVSSSKSSGSQNETVGHLVSAKTFF